ncbi:hypothetical protein C1I97_22580 [Streptomyces sp. NTH33]|nr:hypothetical protein C1I97_22580 [Streptomyces sp. NTH33]
MRGEPASARRRGGGAPADKVRASCPDAVLDRLVGVKDTYDPTNLFRLNQDTRPSTGR